MINQEQELITIHHGIVDSVMGIVANLFLIEQISKNSEKVFVHNGIKVNINTDLIVLGLRVNLKELLIEERGEREGLNMAYSLLKGMYFEGTDKKPIELTDTGLDLLNTLFISVIEDSQTESNQLTPHQTLQ